LIVNVLMRTINGRGMISETSTRADEIAATLDERVGLARKPARLSPFLSDCHTWPECTREARPELPSLER